MKNEFDGLQGLIGKVVTGILMDERSLTFETNEGYVVYWVDEECCSYSYFFDFYGVEHLIGSEVMNFEEVELSKGDVGYREETWKSGDDVYGYRITTIHPLFGEVSSVLSFRNANNGYYGGWMTGGTSDEGRTDEQYRLTSDKIG